jgi:hypothetical protein
MVMLMSELELMCSLLLEHVPGFKEPIGNLVAEATNQKFAGRGSSKGEPSLQVSKKEPHLGEVLEY